jgi:deazaflavin-dependent oxidoreductase (nitroreductase family)
MVARQPVSAHDAPLAPTRAVAVIRRVARPIWLLVGIAADLEVAGRRTGTVRRVSLVPVKLDGTLYLLAFGGVTDWARNLRAAGRCRLHHKRRSRAFNAIEVDGDERDRVIVRYLAGAGPSRKDFNRRPGAAEHPTFRLEPAS